MSDLTATELRVLGLVAEGMSTLEIAFEARRSYETIKRQRSSILFKLGANGMPHAVALAFREGLLT